MPVSRSPTRRKPVELKYLAVAGITLASAIVFSSFFKGFLKTIPVLMGIIVGYVVSIPLGLVSFTGVKEAAWIGLPTLTFPVFQLDAILIIAPVAFVVIIEHIGHLLVINEITGQGLHADACLSRCSATVSRPRSQAPSAARRRPRTPRTSASWL